MLTTVERSTDSVCVTLAADDTAATEVVTDSAVVSLSRDRPTSVDTGIVDLWNGDAAVVYENVDETLSGNRVVKGAIAAFEVVSNIEEVKAVSDT